MRINCKKTQLLLVSPPNGIENTAYINLGEERIESTSRLKLLGFVFGQDPTAEEHVNEIKKKFKSRGLEM